MVDRMKKVTIPPVSEKAKGARRGRPPGGAKAAARRFNTRFPESLVEKMEQAAALRGVPISAFIQEAVAERAEKVLQEEMRWQLSHGEASVIGALIARPPKPNKAMLEAAKRAARDVIIRS